MARKKISRNALIARYREQEKAAKEQFKKETGKKIATGFKKTKDFKRIRRNKRAALKRYYNRRVNKAIKTSGFSNIRVIHGYDFYYNVLSYGGAVDKVAAANFNLFKMAKIKFEAVLDFTLYQLGRTTHLDNFGFDMKMRWLYSRLEEIQEREKNYILCAAVAGNFNGKLILLVFPEGSDIPQLNNMNISKLPTSTNYAK